MSRSDEHRLEDIMEAAQKLAELVEYGHNEFQDNWIHQKAAERLVEIIGEAVTQLSPELAARLPTHHVDPAKGMRIVLTHSYHRVDQEIIWQTISEHVPDFVDAIESELGISLRQPLNVRVQEQRIIVQPVVTSEESLCGAPTKSGRRCSNPAPIRGQRCAAGHQRL